MGVTFIGKSAFKYSKLETSIFADVITSLSKFNSVIGDQNSIGYIDGSWYEDSEFTIPISDSSFIQDGLLDTFYFKLETPISYTVAFDNNNSNGNLSNMDFVYDTAQNLSVNTFTTWRFSWTVLAFPVWPAILIPLNTLAG